MHTAVALALAAAGCHAVTRTELARPGSTSRERIGTAVPGAPALVLVGDRLRFIEPLACPTRETVSALRGFEVVRRPNLAAFVVGVVATATGAVLAIRGAGEAPAANPFLVGGAAALGGGLALAIGPWIGTGTTVEPAPSTTETRPGPPEPCGDRPVVAAAATLAAGGLEVHGAVDRAGMFAVSPFAFVDAYEAGAAGPLALAARLEPAPGAAPRPALEAVLPGAAVATAARAFLDAAPFDARVEPLRKVPGVVAGTLRVSLTQTSTGPALRVVLPLRNDGPGDAWALRGHLAAPGTPALDGRVLYVGHLARGEAVVHELIVPLRATVAAALRAGELETAVELRDAHGTAPTTPVRFRGAVLLDVPR